MNEKDNYVELFNKRWRIDTDELDISGLNMEQQFNLIDIWISWYFREPWRFEKKDEQHYLILKKDKRIYFADKDHHYKTLVGWKEAGEILLNAEYFEEDADYDWGGEEDEKLKGYNVDYEYKYMDKNKKGYLIIDY